MRPPPVLVDRPAPGLFNGKGGMGTVSLSLCNVGGGGPHSVTQLPVETLTYRLSSSILSSAFLGEGYWTDCGYSS